MELFEFILITAGSILFIVALVIILIYVKKEKPFTNAIWLILIAFFMMGFSAISNAEVFGLFKYEKEKKLAEIETLAEASQICPDNSKIKKLLANKIKNFENTEKVKSAEDKATIGYAYYSIDNQNKAIKYSQEALSKDKSNKKAKGVIELAKTKKLLEELPQTNKEQFQLEVENRMKSLEESPNVDDQQIKRLREDIEGNSDLLQLEEGQINHK
jgi:hypothetical protein